MDFIELARKASKTPTNLEKQILCFDPGHTTGWALFHKGQLEDSGQIDTTSMQACLENAQPIFHLCKPEIVVMEDYRVYKWRQKQHVGSEMLTTRIIGGLEILALQDFVDQIIKQPAHVAKQFCTDQKLKDWGYYQPGLRHARDAVRHGCYFIMFGAVRKQDQNG